MKESVRLYNVVTVPRICYTADLWYTPTCPSKSDTFHAGPVGITRHLESLQHQAAISIMGAMKTAPGNAVIVHTNLTPMGLQLRESSTKAYLCFTSCLGSHPITKHILKTYRHQVKRHWTT